MLLQPCSILNRLTLFRTRKRRQSFSTFVAASSTSYPSILVRPKTCSASPSSCYPPSGSLGMPLVMCTGKRMTYLRPRTASSPLSSRSPTTARFCETFQWSFVSSKLTMLRREKQTLPRVFSSPTRRAPLTCVTPNHGVSALSLANMYLTSLSV